MLTKANNIALQLCVPLSRRGFVEKSMSDVPRSENNDFQGKYICLLMKKTAYQSTS